MRRIINPIIALLVFTFAACDDILEEDISDSQITIISPSPNTEIEGNSVQFLWSTLEGAETYTVQIYSGNNIVEDTILSSTPFVSVLSSGNFEWRIKASNNAYETDYNFPIPFSVIETSDLTNQLVVLNNPSNNLYTNGSSIVFTWDAVPLAENYLFQLIRVTASGGETVVFIEDNIVGTTIELDDTILDEESEYYWQVKAKNSSSETSYSSRTFFIDRTVPPIPSLDTPAFEEEFILTDEILFSWNFNPDPGVIDSPITSRYEIASDANFNSIIENGMNTEMLLNYTFMEPGTYYWRVMGEDEAGNTGAFNSNGKLIVNE